ncbi:MAG: fibronectin type III domain-containing protein [Lachnospiraceae bacterium]|nr:fibronectin type III domain-containing protein [Lachnospiraceae bacterium]
MKNKTEKPKKKLLAFLLSLCMLLTLIPSGLILAAEPENAASITFTNTSGDGGEDLISMSEERSFRAECPLPEGTTAEEAQTIADSVVWSLTRDHGYLDESQYPFYYKGDTLENWMQPVSKNPKAVFTDISTTVSEDGSALILTFNNNYLFATNKVNGSRQVMMDYVGYYDLTATYGDTVLGRVSVKLNAYDDYHTMAEFYEEIDALYEKAQTLDNIYVTKESMGTSTSGLDMPYLIIAKDADVLTRWQELSARAEESPDEVLAELENGTLGDFQVPILYSNVHADETVGADCVMEFAWDLVNAAAGEATDYNYVDGFTKEGEEQLAYELDARNTVCSELTREYTYWFGEITGSERQVSTTVDLEKYYTMGKNSLDADSVSELLDDVFFILVPEENVDGRTYNTRNAAGGVDLNRDNSFQTQNETQNMTHMIASWNPVTFMEMHGFVSAYQAEPCDPPHEPNFEYDLLAHHLMTGGEAFASGAISNNDLYNCLVMPQRDYLKKTDDEASTTGYIWDDPWDDMSTSYTPQYAMLHGTISYTVEAPSSNQDAMLADEYGFITLSKYVASDKTGYFKDQCTIFSRGVNNIDTDEVRPWYTDQYDKAGAEAEAFRPKYEENDNFFPECYIIPLDSAHQKNLDSAYDMLNWLVRNDVKVTLTTAEFTYKGVTYPAGTMIVSMYQAKRGVANGVLYDGVVIEGWTQLYSEPITAFKHTRGFDMITCTNKETYNSIEAVCGDRIAYDEEKDYAKDITPASELTGVAGHDVIIANVSTDATAAVNALLKSGKTVGMITSGKYKGDFVVSYSNWLKVSKDYVISGTGINEVIPDTYDISGAPVVYINGVPSAATSGYINYYYVYNGSYNYNYDRQSFEMMNFKTTTDPSQADFIAGNRTFSDASLKAVQNGTPYIGYGGTVLKAVSQNLLGEDFAYSNVPRAMDALFYCNYAADSMTTAGKITHKDEVMYGYGLYYITSVPETADVLATVDGSRGDGSSEDVLLEGFIPSGEAQDAFRSNSIQGFSYQGKDKNGNDVDLTIFANTLTNKMHQEDEFNLISSTIFSKMLTDDAYDFRCYKDETPETNPKPETPSTDKTVITVPAKVTIPATVKIKALKNLKSRKAKLVFSAAKDAKKYEIYFSTKKNMKSGVTIVTTKKTSYTFKKLTKGKTYYVKVRGVNGNTYGKWSKVKRVKIKK